MEEMNLYIDEVLRFYYKKLAKLQKETRQVEKAIKVFEEKKGRPLWNTKPKNGIYQTACNYWEVLKNGLRK